MGSLISKGTVKVRKSSLAARQSTASPVCGQATQHQHGDVPGLAVRGGAAAAADIPAAGAHQGPAHPAVPRRRRLQGPQLDC